MTEGTLDPTAALAAETVAEASEEAPRRRPGRKGDGPKKADEKRKKTNKGAHAVALLKAGINGKLKNFRGATLRAGAGTPQLCMMDLHDQLLGYLRRWEEKCDRVLEHGDDTFGIYKVVPSFAEAVHE